MPKGQFDSETAKKELFHYVAIHAIYTDEMSKWAHYQKASDAQKESITHELDGFLNRLMSAKNGDSLNAAQDGFKAYLKKLDNAHMMMKSECDAIAKRVDELTSIRQSYLPPPFNKKSRWKGRGWVLAGTAIASTALALTIVGAPLIPVVALGGTMLAYGATDLTKELASHIREKYKLQGVTEGQSFNHFQALVKKGNKKDIDTFVNQYSVPKVPNPKPSKEKSTMKKIKWGLAIAGVGLAVAALVAAFPPVGIPVAAAVTLGALSTGVLGGSGFLMAKKYINAKKQVAKDQEESMTHLKSAEERVTQVIKETKTASLIPDDGIGSTAEIVEDELKEEKKPVTEKVVDKLEDQIEEEKKDAYEAKKEAHEAKLESMKPKATLTSNPEPKEEEILKSALEEAPTPFDDEEKPV